MGQREHPSIGTSCPSLSSITLKKDAVYSLVSGFRNVSVVFSDHVYTYTGADDTMVHRAENGPAPELSCTVPCKSIHSVFDPLNNISESS